MTARALVVRAIWGLALICSCLAPPCLAQETPPGNTCVGDKASGNQLVPVETIIGEWVSDDGDAIEISPKTPHDTRLLLKGKYEWEGTYSDGKVTFTRIPTASEMGSKAPEWARKKVEGQLKWSLELQVPHECDELVLKGPWFPGAIKFHEEKDVDGKITKQDASLVGPGTPIDQRYARPLPPVKLQLFAVGVQNLKKITELYWGVPTVVEAVYEEPQDKDTTIIEIVTGDSSLKLTAHRDAEDFRRFLTDTFLPGADKRSLRWEEPPAPGVGSDDDANNPLDR
jgi:hypothetical protein